MTDEELKVAWDAERVELADWLSMYFRVMRISADEGQIRYIAEKALLFCKGGALSGEYKP